MGMAGTGNVQLQCSALLPYLTLTAWGWHLVWRDFYQYATQGRVVERFD
jgi:hypothetical protein